ncbi:MAG: hypothetical protein KDL87_13035 [Verrucomicrobiae bacterium]|nr:hypothetical protein [Verrucomicrobiae bacterium]
MRTNTLTTFIDHPLFWLSFMGVVFAILAWLASRRSQGGKRIWLVTIGALCALCPGYVLAYVFKPELVDARHRAYKSFYHELQIGMTREEVIASLEKHYPAGGARQRPTIMRDTAEELGFFMNPEQSHEPNCEGIFLDLAQGHVTRKRYSRD